MKDLYNILEHSKYTDIAARCKEFFTSHFSFLIILLFLSACNPTKFVGEDEYLYTGINIEFDESSKVEQEKNLATSLRSYARPATNNAVQLWFYNAFYNPEKEKGIGHFLATKVGTAPVLYNQNDIDKSRLMMQNYLQDHGYFNSEITYDTIIQDKTLQVIYTVDSDGQYHVRDVYFPQDTTPINALFSQRQKNSAIKKNRPYRTAALNAERLRLANIARNQGYFEFLPDYIYYFVDTTAGNLQTDIYLRVSDDEEQEQFYMDTAYVYPTFNLEENASVVENDTIIYKDLKVMQRQEFVSEKALKRVIAQDKGDLFREELQDQTTTHLLDMGIFKFVNIKYQIEERNDTNYLRRYIYLTPALTQDVNGEIEASTETSNFLGSAISGSYTHRNIFNGAEQFNVRLSAGIETQASNSSMDVPFISTLEFSAQTSLYLPRFLVPFRKEKNFSYYIPKTRISISDSYQRRTELFTLNSFQFDFGYEWQTTKYRNHSFRPVSANLVKLLDITEQFNNVLNNNTRLKQSFDNVAILGMAYRFTYNDQELNSLRDYTFFQFGVETSGNLTSLISSNGGGSFLGADFSQYVRFDTDTRYNILNKKSSLVSRVLIGAGIPYNNSFVMPYIKQYFVGGANSVRAFPLRGVGPGSIVPDTVSNAASFNQTGDIRIEANIEYRFDLFPFVEGAAFVDAGNVWFLRNQDDDEQFREAEFDFNEFYKQLAVGTGLGIRLDLQFLILRLDVAFPLRKPYLPPSNRWVLDQIKFGSSEWRQANLAYNLAIGYPF